MAAEVYHEGRCKCGSLVGHTQDCPEYREIEGIPDTLERRAGSDPELFRMQLAEVEQTFRGEALPSDELDEEAPSAEDDQPTGEGKPELLREVIMLENKFRGLVAAAKKIQPHIESIQDPLFKATIWEEIALMFKLFRTFRQQAQQRPVTPEELVVLQQDAGRLEQSLASIISQLEGTPR